MLNVGMSIVSHLMDTAPAAASFQCLLQPCPCTHSGLCLHPPAPVGVVVSAIGQPINSPNNSASACQLRRQYPPQGINTMSRSETAASFFHHFIWDVFTVSSACQMGSSDVYWCGAET